jgi:hypothetical protein
MSRYIFLYCWTHQKDVSNHCCYRKAICTAYSECVSVVLVTQHAKGMGRIILPSVVCLALPYFCTLSHKRNDFREMLLNTKRVFWFFLQLLSETFLILRRTQRNIVINIDSFLCKVPVILVRFLSDVDSLDRLSKNTQLSNFMKIRRVGAKLFHADGRTDMTKLVATFRSFANAPKNVQMNL